MTEENSIFLWEIYFPPVVILILQGGVQVFLLSLSLNIFMAVELGGKRGDGFLHTCLGQGENHRQKNHVWSSDGNAIFGT